MAASAPTVPPIARFDDTEAGTSRRFQGWTATVRADVIDDVRPALAWAADRSRAGFWVVGFVAYDAAPAFDAALDTHGTWEGPLAWFAAFTSDDGDPWDDIASHHTSRWEPATSEADHAAAFASVRDRIRAGDTYQVNLTFPMRAAFSGDPRSLYRQLVASQDVGYAAYLDLGDLQVVSGSPERFFAVEDGHITTRPMKGTRRRGRWREEDERLRRDLEHSDKDRAENLMIVDLIRNDVGRIAVPGTVEPGPLFSVEGYRTVWQMTSEVRARLREDVDLIAVFAALFPCGSVTGAPKASTMRIIRDVEAASRGLYCGAIGLIPPGDGLEGASFSVAIRTAVVDPVDGVATYGVGGGVTWDSRADAEYGEALAKAAALVPRARIDGLFETIRWDGRWWYREEHLDRLDWSCAVSDISFDRIEAGDRLDRAVDGMDGAIRIRLVVDRDGSLRVETAAAPDRFADGPGPSAQVTTVAIDPDPVDPNDPTLYVKTTDRSTYDRRRVRHPDVDDVLLTNDAGNITESTIANVGALIHGVWVTPPVEDGLLPGVLRQRLVDDGTLLERSISVPEIRSAQGLALINSVRGWVPAAVVEASSNRRAGSR